MSLSINPETTIGALLKAYPQVEGTLVDLAPAFAKLRNPVVRRTVAKVATLQQAAKIGGVSLQTMILKLRQATGEGSTERPIADALRAEDDTPRWMIQGRIAKEIDADSMLERGVHPIGMVREAVERLGPGEVVMLRSSFRDPSDIAPVRAGWRNAYEGRILAIVRSSGSPGQATVRASAGELKGAQTLTVK